MKPLAIDLCCGLGGWAEGFLDAGFDIIGFDVEPLPYPGIFAIQDIRTLDGFRFSGVSVIVASPPCTEFSKLDKPCWYPEMVGSDPDMSVVDACFRIAREAGVPLVLENVRGAQPYIGRAIMHYGSRYLWGDGLPALLPYGAEKKNAKPWMTPRERAKIPYSLSRHIAEAYK